MKIGKCHLVNYPDMDKCLCVLYDSNNDTINIRIRGMSHGQY